MVAYCFAQKLSILRNCPAGFFKHPGGHKCQGSAHYWMHLGMVHSFVMQRMQRRQWKKLLSGAAGSEKSDLRIGAHKILGG